MANARLSGSLEEEPLGLQHPIFELLKRDLVLGVVLLEEVGDHRVGLPVYPRLTSTALRTARNCENKPDDEVGVLVVDQRGDAAVGIILGILLCLLHVGCEVVVDVAVVDAELLENDSDLPRARGCR